MVKQSTAAKRKADTEARKAAKATKASTAAADSATAVANSSQAAIAAGPRASKGTAKEARAASESALPQTGTAADPAAATAVAGKAELQADADSSQVKNPAQVTQVNTLKSFIDNIQCNDHISGWTARFHGQLSVVLAANLLLYHEDPTCGDEGRCSNDGSV